MVIFRRKGREEERAKEEDKKSEYKVYTDPGDPKKEIFIADVRTKIRGCKERVRTIF